jgi:hypothetical protein
MMKDTEPEDMVFSKDETFGISEGLDDFDDFDIGPQIDEFDNSLDFDFDDVSTETLWVAENLNGGEIVAACWADSEDLAHRLLSQAFRERTGGDLRDCYIREAEADEPDYITDNPELLAEALTEDFDRVKAAAQCSRNCYDFYNAVAAKVSAKEIRPYAKAAAKFVKDNYGLTGDEAEDLLWSGYMVWKQLHESGKKDRKPITESYATKEFEIPNFDAEIVDEFEDEGIKGYNIVYSKNGTDIVEVEVWETDSPVAVNRNLHTPNLMQGYYSSFDAFASDLEYKTSKYVRVRESTDRKPIPEGMTIEQLVEEMEENEDTVECAACEELFSKDECTRKEGIGWLCSDCEDTIVKCTWCEDLYDKYNCKYEVDMGWLCDRCQAAIMSRGETLTFKEGNYWDFLDEEASVHTEEKPHEESASKLEELEEAADYRKRLVLCPECGDEHAYDQETNFCLNCGFN